MIYTVTFSPSLDYEVKVEHFRTGAVNRTLSEELKPGGKGVNVSIVLRNLGVDSVALGFTAGFTGREIERMLDDCCVRHDFIEAEGGCRINVKLKSDEESEINGRGASISKEALEKLFGKLERLQVGDYLVLAGNIPASLSEDVYERILERLQGRGVSVAVDATGKLLRNTLGFRPYLIKPNHHELAELFGEAVCGIEQTVRRAERLQEEGARNVIVSMAGDGAILVAEDGSVWFGHAPKGEVVNSVGAGDSLVAGYLAGILQNRSPEESLRQGIAAGSASAFGNTLATEERVRELLGAVKSERLA